MNELADKAAQQKAARSELARVTDEIDSVQEPEMLQQVRRQGSQLTAKRQGMKEKTGVPSLASTSALAHLIKLRTDLLQL